MNKLTDKIQSRVGKISGKKIAGPALSILLGWVLPSIGITIIFVIVSDFWRLIMAICMSIVLVIYAILLIRKERRKSVPHVKIPVRPSAHETYVEVPRPDTAEIPITAKRTYISPQRKAPPVNKQRSLAINGIELSNFARKQIAQENNLIVDQAVFEIRKPAKVLFFQLEKRSRVIEPAGKQTPKGKAKTHVKRGPRSTIYSESLAVLLSIGVLLLPSFLGYVTLPQWLTALVAPDYGQRILPLVLAGLGGILLIWSLFLFYKKWAYWHYWRLILVLTSVDGGTQGSLIVVDKPPLLGGSVPLMDLQKVNQCFPTTAPTQEEEKGFRSMCVRMLGARWLVIDIIGNQDARFNWLGPIRARAAAQAGRIINDMSSVVRLDD